MYREHRRDRARRATRATGGLAAAALAAATFALVSPGAAEAAKSVTVIAHRGDQDDAPENTVAAFEKAISKGTNVIELDVHYSDSGYPVVIHDATLNRTTSCTGKVATKSRTKLKKCDAGEWFSSKYDDERLPTLRGAMAAISRASGSVKVLLHMKITPTSKMADRTMDDVKAYGMTSRTYVMASNAATFKKMKAEGARHFAYIFNNSSGWDKDYEIMVPYDTHLSSSGISKAHDRGNKVWAVENHPSRLKSMLEAGRVDGILANHLDDLLDLLNPSISAQAAEDAHRHASSDEDDDTFSDEITRPRD